MSINYNDIRSLNNSLNDDLRNRFAISCKKMFPHKNTLSGSANHILARNVIGDSKVEGYKRIEGWPRGTVLPLQR